MSELLRYNVQHNDYSQYCIGCLKIADREHKHTCMYTHTHACNTTNVYFKNVHLSLLT